MMRGSSNARPRHGARRLALPLLLLLLLFCGAVRVAHGFAFVPVMSSFAKQDTSGSKMQSRLVCQQGGGYLASEPTVALHQSVIETVRRAGAGETWFAYLGATTDANLEDNCPFPIISGRLINGVSYGCYWRWNQGRWAETADNRTLPLYIKGVGVTFYIGNTFEKPQSATVVYYGQASGFPSFFDAADMAPRDRRPGMMFGQDLILRGVSDTSTWSDNLAVGGYSYAGYRWSPVAGVSQWNASAQAASKVNFWAACQVQAPSRTMYEMTNTSSALQKNWWIIFFVVLFVVTLVVFLIVALCQDDEDMDEPPEDAPEWAQQETHETLRPKSFVSTRSFRGNTYEDDNDNEKSNDYRRSSSNSGDGGRRRSSDDGYAPQQQHQEMRQASNTGGSQRHVRPPNDYDDDAHVRQSQNNWM
ncbi:hypothetical protein ABB37_07732 [Leptomonas pyrrhocoris]|uniref:Uncharacterized protein n=1 Tax=Leptomonas pyrrhocoris TaxID=157538 RepID=A0A0N0VDR7_LEPPY|nr:hypothetical protein ABB37_07732 [Leptomonas pyrrhocoris]KPA76394.1 hypothetical protein ABB37_07732 [Leptomonas pyrrhocoris]|eukprot:XP_015654833.1 hypothetical protein ABB37_07732 [Leptomonas pyrrhocoris]